MVEQLEKRKHLPIRGGVAESLLSVLARLGFCLDLCLAGGIGLLLGGFDEVLVTEEQLAKNEALR